MTSITIHEITTDKSHICNTLLRALPDWFGIESAIRQYAADVETMTMFVAHAAHRPVGFLALNPHNESTAEIHVMAIHPDHHRHGIGRQLIDKAEDFLRRRHYTFLSVKTLSPRRPDPFYDRTRAFYTATGFHPVQEFPELWGPENPCLLMIKTL